MTINQRNKRLKKLLQNNKISIMKNKHKLIKKKTKNPKKRRILKRKIGLKRNTMKGYTKDYSHTLKAADVFSF